MKLSRLAVHRGSLFEFLRHHPIRRHLNPLFLCSRNHVEQQALYFALMSFGHIFLHGGGTFGGEFVYYFEVILHDVFLEFYTQLPAQAALSCDSPIKVSRTLPGFWTSPIGTS